MDWEAVDLTMDAVFGGDHQPSMLSWEVRRDRQSDLYLTIFEEDRDGMFVIVDSWPIPAPVIAAELKEVDFHHSLFGDYPRWFRNPDPWAEYMAGEHCDRCGRHMNLLTGQRYGLCDSCDEEMNLRLDREPSAVLAWEHGL